MGLDCRWPSQSGKSPLIGRVDDFLRAGQLLLAEVGQGELQAVISPHVGRLRPLLLEDDGLLGPVPGLLEVRHLARVHVLVVHLLRGGPGQGYVHRVHVHGGIGQVVVEGHGSQIHGHAVHPNGASEVWQDICLVEGFQAIVGQGLRDAGRAAGARAGLRVPVLYLPRRKHVASAWTACWRCGETETCASVTNSHARYRRGRGPHADSRHSP